MNLFFLGVKPKSSPAGETTAFSQVKTTHIANKIHALCCMDFHHSADSGMP